MRKFKNFLPLIILVIVIFLISLSVFKTILKQNNINSESSNQFAAYGNKTHFLLREFSLVDLFDEEKVFSIKDLLSEKKKYSLVNFFASWCSSCQAEHEILLNLKRENLVDIYGIAWHDFKKNSIAFLEKNGNPFKKVGLDSQGLFTRIIGIKAVPETLLIDNKGMVVLSFKGQLTKENILEIKRILKQK